MVGLAAIASLWPTLLNNHPYLFWDSYGYFTQGLAYWRLLLGWLGIWSYPPEAMIDLGWIGAAQRLLAADPAIRAIPYSLLFWPIVAGGGFWALVLINALVAIYVVDVALDRLLGLPAARRILVLAILTLVSGLPWFASYAMPDLWAGLMILALVTLTFSPRLGVSQWLGLSAVLGLGAAFHASHLLVAAGLAAVSAGLHRSWQRFARVAATLLLTVLTALGCGWLFFAKPSLAPQGPPFLLARQIEDGPARAYLRDTCPQAGWALCPVVERMESTAQEFLWSARNSYWAMAPLRPAMRREEMAIVTGAALGYPWMQLRASVGNALAQLVRFGLDDHLTGRGAAVETTDYQFTLDASLPSQRWGLGPFTTVIYVAAALGIVVIAWHAWPVRGRRPMGAAGWLLLAGVALNAVVCGVLSGPHARYQGRVTWLLPLLACALLLAPPAAQSERLRT